MRVQQTHILLLIEEIMGEKYESWVEVYETRDMYFRKSTGRHRSELILLTPEKIGKMKEDTLNFLNPPKPKMVMVDPPEGHHYGFPKLMPRSIIETKSINLWLVNNGYPNNLIQAYGRSFHVQISEVE